MAKQANKEIRIVSLLLLDIVFFLLEITIGYAVHSLALIADSFHMLNDIFSLIIALWAVNVSKNKNPDAKYTYGWKRAEILGALVNAIFLLALCVSIFIEAIQRFFEPQEIKNPKLVLVVGTAGLISNIIGLFLFHEGGHGHAHSHGGFSDEHEQTMHGEHEDHSHNHTDSASDLESNSWDNSRTRLNDLMPGAVVESYHNSSAKHTHSHSATGSEDEHTSLLNSKGKDAKKSKKPKSLNMHGVFLHVLGDALGNVGVILTALLIWKTDYSWRFYSDPFVSLVITAIIFSSAIPLSRKASRILLQATPSTISADAVVKDILNIPGVRSVHDFHIWNLTESFFIASLHVEIDSTPEHFSEIAKLIRNIFHRYGIHSATVQPEFITGDVSQANCLRFSRIAGGGVSNQSIENFDINGDDDAYGSTTASTNCLVDQAANCNADRCLQK
ncbi:cation diffusion facilitator family transporter SCDLUD_000726 [Saccharomycodes ludwigii]|uniref:cation diffusion facilitator family transporter n=1 Tax=Saccharomycodes ludwigii TaxID=36035 RepID=UPI001E81E293|nr:hypothetical protein SCDLUD_000726 [Saccharomycodes ludwigii]KAH3903114.1 hypothetical protein SCDLUD_000726 [Saccharomycodes ludwigii]